MKLIKINTNQISRAKELYTFKELNNSITKGKGNLFGALGEIIVNDYFTSKGIEVDFNSTFDYDLIINNKKVDVKTKKYTSKFKPNNKWNLNISDFNTKQKCDYYFFVGVSDNLINGYIYGYIKPIDFYSKAVFNKKNEVDPNGNGIWCFRSDCYNLEIYKLNQFKK
tara:strand:- start:1012 stop:1512 length:501 start_codon:yes stop_codon:yes gene_type:complete